MRSRQKPQLVEREKKIYCGKNWLEVDIFPAFHVAGGRGRRPKQTETAPAQRNFNSKAARKYFIRLCLANFTEDDYRLDLTYAPEFCPVTLEELQKNARNFLRRLAELCKRKELPPPKYVLVNAYGISAKTGQMVRPHHHLIISGGLTVQEVMSLWRQRGKNGRAYGYVSYVPLQMNEDTGIVGLACYLAAQPGGKKRWSSSRNLIKPEFVTNDSRYRKREIDKLAFGEPYRAYGYECCKLRNYEAWCRKYPGWRLVEYVPEYIDTTGAWHVSLRLRREST